MNVLYKEKCFARRAGLLGFIGIISFVLYPVNAQSLNDAQIDLISARLADSALLSWELGTRSQAILELNGTAYSVLSPHSLPPPVKISSSLTDPLAPFFAIARDTVLGRAKANNNTQGPQPLIQGDGSAADPASIGMSVLLANWTRQDNGSVDYAGAAKDQLDYLMQVVPHTSDGAISHRVSEVQLWSDFVYMVPPFIAYYGMVTQNRTLLLEAYNQISLYRNYLFDPTVNMWKHVLLGTSENDEGYWSTGNGWAAAGMLRVLGTIQNSQFANTLKPQQLDLANWVIEIHTGMYSHVDANSSLFTNYASQPVTAPGNFLDASSTALLASTVYRLALMWRVYKHIPMAELCRMALSSSNSSTTLKHFTADGFLTPVVDPHSYGMEGNQSAEGQAFVVEMQSAWRDWVADGSKGANGAQTRFRAQNSWAWIMTVVLAGLIL